MSGLWRNRKYFQGHVSPCLAEYQVTRVCVRERRGKHAFSLGKRRLGVLGSNLPASKAAWGVHLTDVASQLWQVLLLPDLVTAWDKGIYRPPSCLEIISVSVVSWAVIGYKQSKQIENPERFGFGELFNSNHQLCWMWRHLWILTAFSLGSAAFPFFFFFKGVYHTVEVMALLVVYTDGRLPVQVSHCSRSIPPNGSPWALCLQGLFLSVKKIRIGVLVVIIKIL